jgi:hypothetical protein
MRWLRARRQRATESRLAWILGSPRSGSTWLLQMLVDTGDVLPSDEPNIGVHLAPFTFERPGMHAADFSDENSTLYRFGRRQHGYFFSDHHQPAWREPLRELICSRYAFASDWKIVAIKEPHGAQAADLISLAVPQSRFLFLLRDGRDVVDSQLAGQSPDGWVTREYGLRPVAEGEERRAFLTDLAWQWVWRTRIAHEAFERHPGPKLLVKYEDLRRDTESHLGAILEWLEIEADAAAIARQHAYDRAESSGPAERVRSATSGTWRDHLDSGEQALLAEIMGPALRESGYEA